MLADLPMVVYFGTYQLHERIMYSVHHLSIILSFCAVLYHDIYVDFYIFMLTAEISNIFLNGRDVVSHIPILRLIFELGFVTLFFGYRLGVLGPFVIGTVVRLARSGSWYELFVLHNGTLYALLIHIYWSKLIVENILEFAGLRGKKDQNNKSKAN